MYLIARGRAAWIAVAVAACAPAAPAQPLWIGGDVFLGRGLDLSALAALGVGVVNLEGAVDPSVAPGAGVVGARVVLRHAPAVLPQLATAGVRAVGLANNHAADAGPAGPEATATALASLGIAAAPTRWTAGGRSVGLSALRVGAPWEVDGADVSIVLLHDDAPPGWAPTAAMRRAVDAAIAAGADVVVGGGRHAYGTVERRGGAIVAWGLGDLAFDCACTQATEGLLLVLDPAAADLAPEIVPITVGKVGAPVRLADPRDAIDRIEEMGGADLTRTARGARF